MFPPDRFRSFSGFRVLACLALAATSLSLAQIEFVPALPDVPFDYDGVVLPAHYLNNSIPGNSPFQNAAIENDNTPANNPTTDDGATLGRVLFYDRTLSSTGTVSCASCHQQEHGFSDPARLSQGVAGTTRRHSMSLTNARFYEPGKFFWDERAETLEEQVLIPFQDQVEMGLTLDELVALVDGQDYYEQLFTNAFGSDTVTADRIAAALAQFVRSMVSVNSRYDQGRVSVNNPEQPFPNFTNQENRGKDIFFGRGNRPVSCIDCHTTEAFISPPRGTPHASATSATTNNGLDLVSTDDLGVAESTGNVDDTGRFKVPSLRNVAVTAPFMHDGRFDTLEEVMIFYDRDIRNHPQLADVLVTPQGNAARIPMNGQDRAAMIAFLHTLTDDALLTDPKFSDPFVAIAADEQPDPEPDSAPEPEPTDETPEPQPEPVDPEEEDVDPAPNRRPHLVNLSTRARLQSGTDVLIAGFVISGDNPRNVLLRGVGPTLAEFGTPDPLQQPRLELYRDGVLVAANSGWTTGGNSDQLADTADAVGAFALEDNSADSALWLELEPGVYTAHLSSADNNPGTGLIEIYETRGPRRGAGRLSNISARAELTADGEIIVPGFVVDGDGPTPFLIRAIGPALAGFGVPGTVSDPELRLLRDGALVTLNDDWSDSGNAAAAAAAASAVGAFALPAGSADAATMVTLQPGAYTVHVSGATGDRGSVLIEIYAIDSP